MVHSDNFLDLCDCNIVFICRAILLLWRPPQGLQQKPDWFRKVRGVAAWQPDGGQDLNNFLERYWETENELVTEKRISWELGAVDAKAIDPEEGKPKIVHVEMVKRPERGGKLSDEVPYTRHAMAAVGGRGEGGTGGGLGGVSRTRWVVWGGGFGFFAHGRGESAASIWNRFFVRGFDFLPTFSEIFGDFTGLGYWVCSLVAAGHLSQMVLPKSFRSSTAPPAGYYPSSPRLQHRKERRPYI